SLLGPRRIPLEERRNERGMLSDSFLCRVRIVEKAENVQMDVQSLDRLGNEPVATCRSDQVVKLGISFCKLGVSQLVSLGRQLKLFRQRGQSLQRLLTRTFCRKRCAWRLDQQAQLEE